MKYFVIRMKTIFKRGQQIVKIKNSMIQGQYNSWSTLTDVRQPIIMKGEKNILPTHVYLLFHNSEQCISQFLELKEEKNNNILYRPA